MLIVTVFLLVAILKKNECLIKKHICRTKAVELLLTLILNSTFCQCDGIKWLVTLAKISSHHSQHGFPFLYFLFFSSSFLLISFSLYLSIPHYLALKCVIVCWFLFLCSARTWERKYVGHKNIPIMQWWGGERGRSALRHRVALTPLRIHVLVCMAILHHKTWLSGREREQASDIDHRKETLAYIKNAKWAIQLGGNGKKLGHLI